MFNRQCLQSLITILFYLTALNSALKSYKNYKVYKVHAGTESESDFLKRMESNFGQIDFWDRVHRVANASYRVMVPPNINELFIKELIKNNIEHKVIINDVEEVVGGVQFQGRGANFEFNHFWPYLEVLEYLDYLAKNYPNYIKVSSIGASAEKREIRSIYITGERKNGKLQTVVVDATIHAREWISTMMALYLIYELVEKRTKNLKLLLDIDWVIIPIVNPDGYVYTHEKDRFWRKNRSIIPNSSCLGVDPNRNFDFHWDTPDGSSLDACTEDYRGPRPQSEPEVVHLSNFLKKYSKSQLYLTMHSHGGYLLYPYGYAIVPVENQEEHEKLGNLIREKISKRNGYVYQVGNSARMLYPACGGSDDYAIGVAQFELAFTMELPSGKEGDLGGFEMDTSKILSTVKDTFAGLKLIGKYLQEKTNKTNASKGKTNGKCHKRKF